MNNDHNHVQMNQSDDDDDRISVSDIGSDLFDQLAGSKSDLLNKEDEKEKVTGAAEIGTEKQNDPSNSPQIVNSSVPDFQSTEEPSVKVSDSDNGNLFPKNNKFESQNKVLKISGGEEENINRRNADFYEYEDKPAEIDYGPNDADLSNVEEIIAEAEKRRIKGGYGDLPSTPSENEENEPRFWTKYRKWILVSVPVFCVLVTAVVVPTVLLLGKEDPILLSEGEDHWVACPFQDGIANETECKKKGCFWQQSLPPWSSCYFPPNSSHYKVSDNTGSVVTSGRKLRIHLKSDGDVRLFGNPVDQVTLQLDCTHNKIITVMISPGKIEDNDPIGKTTSGSAALDLTSADYNIEVSSSPKEPFHLAIIRKTDNGKVWDSNLTGLVVEEGFLQVGSLLNSPYLYGMSENLHKPFLLRELDMTTWPLFSHSSFHNSAKTEDFLNLNSVHPFYLNLEDNGTASGVLFKTTHPSEYILLRAPGIVFRTIDNHLEFSIFVGESPKDVSRLLKEVVGGASLPPMWALGFHIAPRGNPQFLIDAIRKARIPLDSVTLSPALWRKEMIFDVYQLAVKNLYEYIFRNTDISWIVTLSPTIHPDPKYKAYELGLKNEVFIRWPSDINVKIPQTNISGDGRPYNILFGKRSTSLLVAYIDYENKKSVDVWQTLLTELMNVLPYKGIVTISNEPLNFGGDVYLRVDGAPLKCSNITSESPPYPTAAAWSRGLESKLSDETICMASQHVLDSGTYTAHLKLHNRYGMDMALKTHKICSKGARCLVMSHATAYTFNSPSSPGTITKLLQNHEFSWQAMRKALISVLEFGLLGMPLVAADICTETENTDERLCSRWFQLGSFFPIARTRVWVNQNYMGVLESPLVQERARESLYLRLSLLPYTYSALYMAQENGEPLLRPLFYEFPGDTEARTIDTQFMYGSSIMVAPVLDEESDKRQSLRVYFPDDSWYRLKGESGEKMPLTTGYNHIPDTDSIPLFFRAGHIVPFHHADEYSNVKEILKYPITLRVFPKNHQASGFLYADDGISSESQKAGNHYFFRFEYSGCELQIIRERSFAESPPRSIPLTEIVIHDWEMYDGRRQESPTFFQNVTDMLIPVPVTVKLDFICRPVHDHQMLILIIDIDLTTNVTADTWLVNWADTPVCSNVKYEDICS